MNTIILKGMQKEMWGKAKQKFASISGSNKLYMEGKRDEIVGKAQKNYGKMKDFFA